MSAHTSGPDHIAGVGRGIIFPLGLLCALGFALSAIVPADANLSAWLLAHQDRYLLLAQVGLAGLALFYARMIRHGSAAWAAPGPRAMWAWALALLLIAYAGHYWVLAGHDLSRDEQLASFDAAIFARGALVMPIPPVWRADAAALNTLFMLPVERPVAWVSAYLPMNGAIRALFLHMGDPALTGPVLLATGAVLLWRIVRMIWPDDARSPTLAMLLYAGSGQVVMTGMTSYAMTAHLTANLAWLWLYLIRRPMADVGALLVGFIATGLHQPLFHPMFVAPFVVLMLVRRAWARAALFIVGYGAIGLFWLGWPGWMTALVSGPESHMAARGVDYLTRMLDVLARGDEARLFNMAANLVRFAGWQHALLLPLMMLGGRALRRGAGGAHRGEFLALVAGMAALLYVMLFILPYQGHGFGYRYLHGWLGGAILLALLAVRAVADDEAAARWRTALMGASIAGALVLMPLQMVMAHRFYAPFADISARIGQSGSDIAMVGMNDAPFARDLVVNAPDLSNRPLRLIAEDIGPGVIDRLCRDGARILLLNSASYRPIFALFAMPERPLADERVAMLRPRLIRAGCQVRVLGAPR